MNYAGNVLQPGAGALMARVAHFLRSGCSFTLSSSIFQSQSHLMCLTALSSLQWVPRDGPRLHGEQAVLLWTAGSV